MRPVKPVSLDAPGLEFRQRRTHCAIYWTARRDVARRGYRPTTALLWPSSEDAQPTEPTADDWTWIESECQRLQGEMLHWSNGGVEDDARSLYDGTFGSLIDVYLKDKDSPFQALRFHTKHHYEHNLKTLKEEVGDARVNRLTFRDFKHWHETFRGPNEQVARAHGLMTKVRLVFSFGALLRLGNCAELFAELGKMEFEMPKKRTQFITADQANAIRVKAHELGYPSIALAQAIQFELMLRQKDVIGEWVPTGEPGLSDIAAGGQKWLHGIRWSHIDGSLRLKKVMSKSLRGRRAVAVPGAGKEEEFDLRSYPMIMEELAPVHGSGPLIICDYTGQPWRAKQYQRIWRIIARAAGVPDSVQNRDSRAGGITEATDGGATIEQAQRHAGHATPAMTARYSRSHVEAKNKVADLRVRSRK